MPDGTWVHASDLRPLLATLHALRDGEFGTRVPAPPPGEYGDLDIRTQLTDAVNQIAARTQHLSTELRSVHRGVLRHGRTGERLRESPGRGEWADMVHACNSLLDALLTSRTDATRVLAAVADGDLSQRVHLYSGGRPLRGELRLLGRTVNRMTDQLSLFTSEVTRAALEEDGEAPRRPGDRHTTVRNLSGSWRDAAEAVNQMVSDLRETTRAKEWLESNITRLAALMQGRRDVRDVAELIMRELPPLVDAQFGAFFLAEPPEAESSPRPEQLSYVAGYGNSAHQLGEPPLPGTPGHGLIAQVAEQRRRILLTEVPPGYLPIASGLGAASPACVVILPVLYEERVLGVVELASFSAFSDIHLAFFDQFVHTMGVALHTMRANTELSEKAALLAASSQYKSQFLANMSHELRTPLNSLLVLAQLLADNEAGNLSEKEVRFARTIYRAGNDLLQLISDVLDLSKIEAGRMDVHPQRLPLLKLLNYVHDTFRPVALDRGLGFSVSVAENAPRELHADERRIQQILRNLLSNAFKFTAEGTVRLHVGTRQAEDGEQELTFAVSDTGIGIEPARLPYIFEAFQQGEASTHRTFGGTGLGLSISRELAGLLGGRITVESTPGEGSVFTLQMALTHPSDAAPAGPAEASAAEGVPQLPEQQSRPGVAAWTAHSERSLTAPEAIVPAPDEVPGLAAWREGRAAEVLDGARVLIVDDDVRNVFALTQVLGRVGMTVRYAENGRDGIESLDLDPAVDVVLMDIMMPVMDGYEALRELRADPRFAALPVIALTAQAMPGDSGQSLAAGASAYVPKPVQTGRLLETMLALLDPQSPSARQR
ncbi:ATP-binding protein [Streptomyces sp. ODS28]|uniref:ATP-binding protein n=1 Tax=Streptomyces sp. ODS28 TaxID=3136688 RepID=UPI0031E71E33